MAEKIEALSGAIHCDSGLTESDQLIVENTITDLYCTIVDSNFDNGWRRLTLMLLQPSEVL